MRSSNRHSAFTGNSHHATPEGPQSMRMGGNCFAPNCSRCYNMTTLLYPINTPEFEQKTMGFLGCNKPLRSSHPGGTMMLFADGHVDFLSDSTDIQTLSDLANKDDGNVVSLD